ncbi:hypothetical protein [Streptomyces sp. TLI_185]|uniref:hypothetical protein n=1 Tax=Streptomyces sp. TLI_185 TaxID=2485151 RepID=UPI000F95248A|nr:hypothetical protein [Streptomyces sp. TLI_185]RPF30407.1 hypothetical protein EDD92_0173 [Streptomyces sp. TLI_185]
MTHAIPVPLPSALVDHHAVDLERSYTDGWGMTVADVATAPSGEMYALYRVHRRTYGVSDDEVDPGKADFGYALVTRYAPDGRLVATAVSGQSDLVRQDKTLGGPTTGLGEELWWAKGLCVLPDGTLAVTDMPGKVADFLRNAELDDIERAALDQGVTVRRGQGYTLRVTAAPSVHRQFLTRCQPLDGGHGLPAIPAQRKARREYENRVSTLTPEP